MYRRILLTGCLCLFVGLAFSETNDLAQSGGLLLPGIETDDTAQLGLEMDIERMLELERDFKDAALYYDIGIYYFQENDFGRSILNLKRAYLLNPYDKEITEMLSVARQTLGYPDYLFESTPLANIFMFPFTILTLNVMALVGLILLGIGSLAEAYYLLKLRYLNDETYAKMKSTLRTIITVFVIIGGVYCTASVIRYRVVFDESRAVVVSESTVYTDYENTKDPVAEAEAGLECNVKEEKIGYSLIETVEGAEGWIDSEALEKVW